MRVVILYFLLCVCCVNGLKILSISPFVSHSHHVIGNALAKELAARGHDVTFVSPIEEKESVKNLRRIILTGFLEEWMGKLL